MTTQLERLNVVNVGAEKVMFAGDWHGNTAWALHAVDRAAEEGVRTILHVGDFGIWPGPSGDKFVWKVGQRAAAHQITIAVTPGNHESWARINRTPAEDRNDGWGPVKWFHDNVLVLPRGHRFTLTNDAGVRVTAVSLGGAPSIDFEWRTPNKSWWRDEAITAEDVEATVADGYADLMIAHDAPDMPYMVDGVRDIVYSDSGWSEKGLAYAAEGRALMHRAYVGVQPRLFVHGHYHVHGAKRVVLPDGHEGVVVSLHRDGFAGNYAFLDLEAVAAAEPPALGGAGR